MDYEHYADLKRNTLRSYTFDEVFEQGPNLAFEQAVMVGLHGAIAKAGFICPGTSTPVGRRIDRHSCRQE